MESLAIQDRYPQEYSHCYGCGTKNHEGLHLKSYLAEGEVVARVVPDAKYSGGLTDHLYGGMIASLFDCHGIACAAAQTYDNGSSSPESSGEPFRYVTASLKVDFKRPVPLHTELTIKGSVRSLEGKKAWVDLTMQVDGVTCASAEMLAIRLSVAHSA